MAGLTPTRGLVVGENVVDVAKMRGNNGGRGLVANERIRHRFIRPRRYWLVPQTAPIVAAPPGFQPYPIIGGSFYPT